MIPDSSPPSPGHDDTPYIRFAIDQLTRDEEVRGSRRYPAVGAATAAQADRSTESSEERRRDVVPAYAEKDEHSEPAVVSKGHTQPTIVPVPPQLPAPTAQPFPPRISSRDSFQEQPTPRRAVFVPVDHQVPALKFLPAILRPLWLGIFFFLCLLVLVGLLVSGIYSATNLGLYAYTVFGGGRYFVFQYFPTICGMFMLLWLLQIQVAVQRIAPFIAMASMSSKARSQGPLMDAQPTNFLYPKFFYFKAGQPILGICMFVFWLQIYTVPLFACLYNVYFYGEPSAGGWRWATVQGIVWTLFALYFLLTIAILVLLLWINRQRTGLKWDPRSLADILTLLDRSNIMREYSNSETFGKAKLFKSRLSGRSDRLGYWTASDRPNETFYGIGEEGAATRRYSIENGRIREKDAFDRSSFPPDTPTTAIGGDEGPVDLETGTGFERGRYRYLPWYLRPTIALLWTIAAIALYLAFLVASFVNNAVIRGFAPLTRIAPTSAGFSATNFLYSFIPAVIAQVIFLAWLSVDFAHRRFQPYVNMSTTRGHDGAPASRSVLLDYPARLPISVTFEALINRDLKVAWLTTVTLITATLPILAGGCFWAQYYIADDEVRVSVHPAGYYALCAFLALFVLTLPLVCIGLHKRRLPHACTTLAEQISWLYQSNVLGVGSGDRRSTSRGALGSRAELVARLVSATTERERGVLSGGEGRFVFGKFVGRDGKSHLGVERAGRSGSAFEREKRPQVERVFRGREDSPRPGTPSRLTKAQTPTQTQMRDQQALHGMPLQGNPVGGGGPVSGVGTSAGPGTGGQRFERI